MKEGLNITGLVLYLADHNARFQVVKDEDGVTLKISSPDVQLSVNVSHGQYYGLEAAVHDVSDVEPGQCVTGGIYGNSE